MINLKTNTADIFKEIKQKLMDENFINKYGTSASINMGREYNKYIEKTFGKLQNEFAIINKNPEDGITKQELLQFFQSYEKNVKKGLKLDSEYIDKIFSIMDVNGDEQITIKEFVVAYIILEEKIRIKKWKLEKQIEELNESKASYDNLMLGFKDEKTNLYGVSDNAELKITLIEAKDLLENKKASYFSVISLEKEKQVSSVKTAMTFDPTWNEEFAFKPNSKDRVLIIEILKKTESGKDMFEGAVKISLRDLDSQVKFDDWYTLEGKDDIALNAKIHLKTQFIWSKFVYYQNLINKIDKRLTVIEEERKELDKYFELFKTPFGLILYGSIDMLFENKILDKSDDLTAKNSNNVASNLRILLNSSTDFNSNKTSSKTGHNEKFKWSLGIKVVMSALLFSTLICMVERTDFLNLGAVVALFVIYFLHQNNIIKNENSLRLYWKGLILVILYDTVWFYFHEKGYTKTDYDFFIADLQKAVLVLSILNSGLKLVLITMLFLSLNKSKEK